MSETIMDFILEYRAKYIEEHGKSPAEIYLAPEQWVEVLSHLRISDGSPTKPSPPVKKKWNKSGFLSFESGVEYDYHAPEYLKALDIYNKALDDWEVLPYKITVYGMELKSAFGDD